MENTSDTKLKSLYSGNLHIGDTSVPCAVLSDERRVFWQREILGLLTGTVKGDFKRYISARNLQPFVPTKYLGESWDENIIKFEHQGRIANGFEAEDLIDICYMYINADREGKILPSQKHLVEQAHIIVRSFAKTGVIAVIDEATGYQDVRRKKALQEILDKFLQKEYAAWAKTFPDDFYREIFRLKGWVYDPKSIKRPSIIGKFTNDIVYERLAPNILVELQNRNPVLETGHRKVRHHQYLTEEVGHPALSRHLFAVIALMRASSNWEAFYRLLQRSFPKCNEQLSLLIDE